MDLRFYAPVAILYYAQVSGSYALGMSVFSAAMITAAVMELPTGIYSDMVGRKKTIVAGAMFSLFSVLAYALAGTYVVLLLGAVFEGVARSLYSGNNEAFLVYKLAEEGKSEDYAEVLGRTSAMFQWALAIAALVGGVVADYSLAWVVWMSVVPAVMGLWISLNLYEPKTSKIVETNVYQHIREAVRMFVSNSKLRTMSIANVISYAAGEAGYQFRAAFVQTLWPVWAIGLAQMLANIGAAISFRVSGRVVRRFGALPTWLFGKVYGLVSNVVAYVWPNAFSPVLISSSSVLFGTGMVASSELMQKEYSDEQRSTMGSLNSLAGSVGFSVLAFILGTVADGIGPARALLYLQILAVVSLGLLCRVHTKYG